MTDPTNTPHPASEQDTDLESDKAGGPGDQQRAIDADSSLSPVVEQQGGAALANVGERRASELFKPD